MCAEQLDKLKRSYVDQNKWKRYELANITYIYVCVCVCVCVDFLTKIFRTHRNIT